MWGYTLILNFPLLLSNWITAVESIWLNISVSLNLGLYFDTYFPITLVNWITAVESIGLFIYHWLLHSNSIESLHKFKYVDI